MLRFRLRIDWVESSSDETLRVTPVHENYRGYIAPAWVRPTVERLLRSIPNGHLNGISAVVLVDTAQSQKLHTHRRARRNRHQVALGRYHSRWQNEPAWIELVIDEIVTQIPRPLEKLQLSRDVVIARVLFHEIGHHLHAMVGSFSRDKESSAEAWRKHLSKIHFRARYWYLRPFIPLLSTLARRIRAIRSRGRNAE